MTAAQNKEPPRIVLFNPSGWGNLGDGAIVAAISHALELHDASVEFIGVTLRPSDTRQRHGVRAYPMDAPNRHGWAELREQGPNGAENDKGFLQRLPDRLYNAFLGLISPVSYALYGLGLMRRTRGLLVAGGGQLDDYWGGTWGQPFRLFRWCLLARLAGRRVAIVSVGMGSIRSRGSRFFFRSALQLAHYTSIRDPHTLETVRTLSGVSGLKPVPDLALSYPTDRAPADRPDEEVSTIGLSPLAFFRQGQWPEADDDIYSGYIDGLCGFAEWLIGQGYRVILFATDSMDVESICDIEKRLPEVEWLESDSSRPDPYYKSVDELLSQLERMDIVVASRLHGVILSHVAEKPTLAISYDWKVDQHMIQFDQQAYCADINKITVDGLATMFNKLLADRQAARSQIRRSVAESRTALKMQTDTLAELYGLNRN